MTFSEFKYNVGEVVMFCQIIENDIKYIYCSMLNGDLKANLYALRKEKMTLGQTILKLKELDYSDDDHFFQEEEYDYLLKITGIRNHWCHDGYTRFVYIKDFINSDEYLDECNRLENDHNRLKLFYKVVHETRIKAMKQYGRN